ncbi:SDR family oxidoreductase [Glycomyces albidus]|uniref:NAD(P)H-binding protein n=1 Tax=Glycomyces albidus TaxID=2656774 RepID=A0A6L5G8J9_9ACTN|nr:NmrA family NAD(P)-binding protein [Glycomyces albidus]MQM25977.1 NAD(P)H-binding protein [Glycomyces albidus]
MTILVTGAAGNVGRHLVEQLAAAGHPVRALTRDPAKARFPEVVEAVEGDFADTASLERALDGATGLHLMTAFGPKNETVPHSAQLASAALEAGVKRVTLLWNGYRGPVEEAFAALNPTELQPGEFMSNALTWAEEIKAEGVVREAFGHIGHAPVHEGDIAAVAAVALTTDDLAGQRLPLTGPEVLNLPDQIGAINDATGRDVRFEALNEDEGRLRMQALGYDEPTIDYVLGWRADPPAWTQRPSDTVERVTGRPARTFAEWAREHADAFR